MRAKHLKNTIIMALCVLITTAVCALRARAASDSMTIYAIDLGQNNEGEATMIVGGDGASLLIDAGDKNTVKIFSWLKSHGYDSKKFDLLVTHWHDDHVYYVSRIIKDYPVGKVYLPGTEYATTQHYRDVYRSIINAANKKKTKVVTLKKNMAVNVGAYVDGKVLYVNGYDSKSGTILQRYNNQSAAIMFKGGGSRFLACGDAMEAEEKKILASGADIKADIFKLNHHGYPGSNTRDFVDAVSPSYGWFTTNNATPGNYNPISVREIVRRTSAKTNLFSTRYNGTTIFKSSGGKISVSAERNTAKMYRRVKDAGTGKERTVTFTFNKFVVPRFTDKILDTKSLLNSRQVDSEGRTFHGDLVQDSAGYWYVRDDSGMYGVYTLARSKGRYYWIEKNGRRFSKGKIVLKGKEYYFRPDRKSGFVNRDGFVYYYADEKNYSGYSAGIEGVIVKGFATIADRRYYFKDSRLLGYKSHMAGRMATEWNTIAGNKYYMNERGVIQKGLKEIHKKKYYFDKYGIMLKGMRVIGGARYYFDPVYGQAHTNEWYPSDRDHRYYFGPDGKAYVNKNVVIAGYRYHFNGKGNPYVGWHEFNGKTYYAYKDGRLASGRKTIDGKLYIFNTMKNGCALLPGKPSAGVSASSGQDTAAGGNTSAPAEEMAFADPEYAQEEEPGSEDPGIAGEQENGTEEPGNAGEQEDVPEEPGEAGESETPPEDPDNAGDEEPGPDDPEGTGEQETAPEDPGSEKEQETGKDDPENEPETAPYEEEEQGDGSEGSEEYDAGSGSTQGL